MITNLLIGGSGFIGSALGKALLDRGETVISVSHNGQGDAPGVQSVKLDLYQQSLPQDLVEKADNIFILVGQVHEGFDMTQELQLVTNLTKTVANGSGRVFYFSTVHVYGETVQPAAEDSSCQPIDEYGRYKLECEGILAEQIDAKRLTVFRLTNIYGGPGNRGFIGLLMKRLADPEPRIDLNGNGKQQRDYLFLDDLIEAIMAIRDKTDESGVVNIATGTSYPLTEVVELVAEVSGRPIKHTVTHKQVLEAQSCLIDTSRLRQVYGFDRFTNLKDGLAKTSRRYQEQSR